MKYPTCSSCGKTLKDWHGNVMVDSATWPERTEWIKIICKDCTGKLDDAGVGQQYHNLWELRWLKDKASLYGEIECLLDNVTLPVGHPSRTEWSRQALGDVLRLVALSMGAEIDEEHHHDVWEVKRW